MKNDPFARDTRSIVQEMPARRHRVNWPALAAIAFCVGCWFALAALFGGRP